MSCYMAMLIYSWLYITEAVINGLIDQQISAVHVIVIIFHVDIHLVINNSHV